MNTPRLEIHLDRDAGLCISKVERPNAVSRLILDIELEELRALPPTDAAYRVGGTVLNILGLWHKEELKDWTVPAPAGQAPDDDFYIALRLIDRSLAAKSSAHIESIELLLRQAAEADSNARTYFQGAWPLLRDRLEKSQR